MQFHLDGFRPGDPSVADPNAALAPTPPDRPLPAEVDVLIVGCGPAGLTLAAQLSAFADVSVCIAEAKPGPLQLGQADGIACRTMEMFQAFGFAHEIAREAYWVNETVFWKPDPDRPDHIRRSDRIQDVEDGLSEMPHVILNQARVHDHLLRTMRNSPTGLEPHYGCRFVDLELPSRPNDPDARVLAHFEHAETTGAPGAQQVRARFVVGCDGARSQVRRAIGRELVGDAANQAWGVMDVLAVTDFPDIRFKAVVHSAGQGNLLVIPREGGYLVRLYIELDKLAPDERVADRDITVERLVESARRILNPYTLSVEEVAWWSVYEIGQRMTDRFDDVPVGAEGRMPRVFIAGDACHTHSPKAGQGMNVSVRDAFNLGWKLAAVLRGVARPDLLHTYSAERHGVAKQLIDFDREFAAMFSAAAKTGPTSPDVADQAEEGIDPAVFQRYFQQAGRFTAGVATRYSPSLITGHDRDQGLASGFEIGTRFHSAPVLRVADAKPMQLGHVVAADGRWRLFAFADGVRPDDPASRLAALCRFLEHDARSPIVRTRRAGADESDLDAVIDVRAVVQQHLHEVTVRDVPSILRPTKGRYRLIDHEKVFCADARAGDIFEMRGVDRATGALVVVRPDQHVAHVLALDAFDDLASFFDAFLLPSTP